MESDTETEPEAMELSGKLLKTIISESSKGKTSGRILLNHVLSEFEVSGKVIDLGSSSDKASYNRFLRFKEPYEVTYTDFYKGDDRVMKLDLEKPFSGLADASYDVVMCFNVLEHIYDHRNVVSEGYRILKPGGRFIGSVPFLAEVHLDPNDYFRYTYQALEKLFESEGFEKERMVAVGFGPLSASAGVNLVPRLVRAPGIILSLLMDEVLNSALKQKTKYPLDYVFEFRKP